MIRHRFAVVALTLLPSLASAQHSSCPSGCPALPRTARYEATGLSLPALPATLLTATLRRGKPGYVLEVEAMFHSQVSGQSLAFVMYPRVNGVYTDSATAATIDCGGTGSVPTPKYCGTSGVWWIDLDQHPELIGSPLVVELIGGVPFDGGPTGQGVDVTMSVRLQRK